MCFVKKIWQSIFSKHKTEINQHHEDLNISIGIDTVTEKISFIINTNITNLVDDNSNIYKCEKIAFFLSLLSYNNRYMSDLICAHIEEQKKISHQHLLFYNNILFFWKQYLTIKNDSSITNNSGPLISPTKAFKIHLMDEK